MTMFDDNFTSLTNSNPVNMWFWVVNYYAPAVHSVSGVVSTVFIEQDIEFYDRLVLNNSVTTERNERDDLKTARGAAPCATPGLQPRFYVR